MTCIRTFKRSHMHRLLASMRNTLTLRPLIFFFPSLRQLPYCPLERRKFPLDVPLRSSHFQISLRHRSWLSASLRPQIGDDWIYVGAVLWFEKSQKVKIWFSVGSSSLLQVPYELSCMPSLFSSASKQMTLNLYLLCSLR